MTTLAHSLQIRQMPAQAISRECFSRDGALDFLVGGRLHLLSVIEELLIELLTGPKTNVPNLDIAFRPLTR